MNSKLSEANFLRIFLAGWHGDLGRSAVRGRVRTPGPRRAGTKPPRPQRLRKEAEVAKLLLHELEIARDVQQQLLPQAQLPIPGLEYAGYCRSAESEDPVQSARVRESLQERQKQYASWIE